MKLTRIEIENVRRFKAPVVIENLDSGLNLFTGPNGAGKSTLIAAVRACFFERYKTNSLALRPIDDSSASPKITVAFETGGKHYQLTKQFLGQKRCDLLAGSDVLDGEEAEDHLATLLGYSYAGRGLSKVEHWGIPGLLWIEQGAGQDLADAVGYAKDRLQGALQSMVGAVASTGGDSVIEALRFQRSELVTDSSRTPRGPYLEAKRAFDDLDGASNELTAQLQVYRADVDRLAADSEQLASLDKDRPWQALQTRAEAVQAQLDSAKGLQSSLDAARREYMDAKQLGEMYLARSEQLNASEKRRPAAVDAAEAAEVKLAGTESELAVSKEILEAAEAELVLARNGLKDSRQASRRKELEAVVSDLRERILRMSHAFEQASLLTDNRREHQRTMAINGVDAEVLAEARKLSGQVRDLGLQVQAVGTRVDFAVNDGVDVTLGDAKLAGNGSMIVDSPTLLAAPGINVTLTPGGDEIPRLQSDMLEAKRALEAILGRLGLPDVVEAEARANRFAEAERADELLAAQLQQLAPNGLDHIESDLAAMQAQLGSSETELSSLPSPTDSVVDMETAEGREQSAIDSREVARERVAAAALARSSAESSRDRANEQLAELDGQLQAPERAQMLRSVRDGLAQAVQRRDEARARVEHLEEQILALNLTQLEQDARRFRQSARQEEDRHRKLKEGVIELRAKVHAKGAEGIEERLADIVLRRDQAGRRLAQYARQVEVLNYLLDQLEPRRERVRQQLIAPLQTRIDHYLRMLLPDSKLEMADSMQPMKLLAASDSRTLGEFDLQSFGTREQLALICRLAYADLLRESGAPTLLILDDALVHTDDARLAAMKRVLYDAAERHQILMMTCHPDRWRDLGAKTTAMSELTGS